MVQMAWNFVNDSLSTTVCLQWEPEIIAVALIHLASKLSKFSVTKWDGQQPTHLRWWDMFVADVTMEILEDICHQVLDLYQQTNQLGMDSPPQLPPSKSSPPAKRAKVSPAYAKSSPSASSAIGVIGGGGGNIIHSQPPPPLLGVHHPPPAPHHHPHAQQPHHQQPQHQHQQHSHHKASIDEKLQNMPPSLLRNSGPPSALDPMSYGTHAYAPAGGAYGTMFQPQFGAPPPGGQPPLPPQQSGMYSGNPSYGPPQQIPSHYQSGVGGGGSQMPPQNYYQQPPPPGRGGYYQGPP